MGLYTTTSLLLPVCLWIFVVEIRIGSWKFPNVENQIARVWFRVVGNEFVTRSAARTTKREIMNES